MNAMQQTPPGPRQAWHPEPIPHRVRSTGRRRAGRYEEYRATTDFSRTCARTIASGKRGLGRVLGPST